MSQLPVLVTGGAGYIGSHAVLAFRDAGWAVSVIDDLSTGTRAALPADVPFYQGSISDTALVRQVFDEQQTEAIIHFAGQSSFRNPWNGRSFTMLTIPLPRTR